MEAGHWEPEMYVRSGSKKYKRNSPNGEGGRNPSKSPKIIFPKISYDFFTFYNALSHYNFKCNKKKIQN